MTDKNITHLIESVDTIDIGKSAIEPTVNADTGVKSFGYKDPDGNARRCLTTDSPNLLDADQYAELTKFTQAYTSSNNVSSDIGTVLFNASSAIDMTLLSAVALVEGTTVTFKDLALNAETYTLRILTQGAETIDGDADFTFTKNGQAVTVRAYNGNWEIVADANVLIDAKYIQGVPVSADVPAYVALKNWLLVLWYYTNMYLWSSDIAQAAWGSTIGVTFLGTDGFVPPAAPGNYRLLQGSTHEIGDTVYNSFKVKKGINNWILCQIENAAKAIGFDLVNGVQGGTLTAGINYSITDAGDGFWEIKTDTVSAISGTRNINVYSSDDGISATTTGDGVNPAYYIKELQNSSNVSIAKNLPHIPTTTVPVSAPAYVYKLNPTETTTVNASTYTILPTDRTLLIDYSATGACAITWPSDEIAIKDRTVTVIDSGGSASTGNITQSTEGSETINGAATKVISTDYGRTDLVSNGSNLFG